MKNYFLEKSFSSKSNTLLKKLIHYNITFCLNKILKKFLLTKHLYFAYNELNVVRVCKMRQERVDRIHVPSSPNDNNEMTVQTSTLVLDGKLYCLLIKWQNNFNFYSGLYLNNIPG